MDRYRDNESIGVGAGVELSVEVARDGPSGPFDLKVDFTASPGSFVALVGSSGAGKTTLLRLLAGLTRPDHGRIRVGSAIWCDTATGVHIPVRRRSIGFVFQDYALFPNMTVRGNVEYAIGGRLARDEAQRLLEMVELAGLGDAYPARISGGQKQRLALIRALARKPALLMLDEPLSALDPILRRRLQDELKRLHQEFGTTTFLVSHDVSEILRLAGRVIRLEQGRIVVDGDPVSAFSSGGVSDGVNLIGEYVSGPDETGYITALVEGRLRRFRLRNRSTFSPGDSIILRLDEAETSRLA